MGLYIEPKEGTKRAWIELHGTPQNPEICAVEAFDKTNRLPVAFLDNINFHALAVAWNKKEFRRIAEGRLDALWFTVPAADLLEVLGPKAFKAL